MGKPTSSCFKLLPCGADSTEIDDLSPTESKASSEKRRWSFRRRSIRHQVPSNTVVSEPQFVSYDKGNPEATANNFYSVKDSSVPEKPAVTEELNETATLASSVVNSEATETLDIGKTTAVVDSNLQENVAVVIQAAVRRFLAQRELQKLRSVVKLQAAVRGHLVRRQAIGTLRCVQAMVKMQALVRGRLARQSLAKCGVQEKPGEKAQIDSQWSKSLVKRNSDLKLNKSCSTVQKLLSNGFARQLLEATPKTKPIHISCDPLRPDSAWQWLDRWMAVTSPNIGQQQELNWNQDHQGYEESSNPPTYEEADAIPCSPVAVTSNLHLFPNELASVEDQQNSANDDSGKFEFQAPGFVLNQFLNPSVKDGMEQSQGEEELSLNQEKFTEMKRVKETSEPVSTQLSLQLDEASLSKHDYNPDKPNLDTDNLKNSTQTTASDPTETDGKRFELGSRKMRNPAFAAVHAKFEELSSAPKANRSISSVCREAAVESKPESSQESFITNGKELSSSEYSTTKNPVIQVAASECGTEISISSTLDSPDRSEADGGEIVLEMGILREGYPHVNGSTNVNNELALEDMKSEAKQHPADSSVFQQQRVEDNEENMANSDAAADSVWMKQQPELTTSGTHIQQENSKDSQTYKSSPEGSPRSHGTAPELHGLPLSQVSELKKTNKTQNNIPALKSKSKSVSKSSPSNQKNDSGGRSSTEHLSKDAKIGKRRSSFGMAKLDNADHEPRLSSSNTLPSYMQATESAKAKVHGNVSLKSSPDVHEKESYTKKRHSLPIGDEKQGSSPRVQRSTSQVQQSLKGNNTNSPQSSAERRWQR